VIELLDQRFVSTWILAKDLEHLSFDRDAPAELRELAKALRGRYAYPVDTQVVAPGGELLGQLAANEGLRAVNPAETYHAFLLGCRGSP